MTFDSFHFTSQGGRPDNQDTVFVCEKESSYLYVVADGLGGHQHGRVASDCVVSSIADSWKSNAGVSHIADDNANLPNKDEEPGQTESICDCKSSDEPEMTQDCTDDSFQETDDNTAGFNETESTGDPEQTESETESEAESEAEIVTESEESLIVKCIEKANFDLIRLQQEMNSKMKSTVAVLSVCDDKAVWAHTGDTRLYFIHDNELKSITEDHSVAYKKYKAGEITRSQIGKDEDQSSLLKVLGNETRWEPDTDSYSGLKSGDAFFLCSDGMWEYLRDEEILVDYLKSDAADDWMSLLLLRVMNRIKPNNDNLTGITLIIKE